LEHALHELVMSIVELVHSWGYAGLFIMMFIESSFVPFPSEVAMVPAGYLVSQDRMNAGLAIFAAIGGSLSGAFLNYQLALRLGLPVLERIGHYFFLKPQSFQAAEDYFDRHGEITTFVGRLIPGIRQLISIPAGLARMNLPRFFIYTALGSGLWSSILVGIGYVAGAHEDVWRPLLQKATSWIILAVFVLILGYIWFHKRRNINALDAENTE